MRGLRDVSEERAVAHAACVLRWRARDPSVSLTGPAGALSAGERGRVLERNAARAAGRSPSERRRRRPGVAAADPRLGVAGRSLRPAAGAAGGSAPLRLGRPQPDADLLPPRPTRVNDLAAPFDTHRDVVRPEWIDHNGHMNVGYYLVVFDFATDDFMAWVGLDAPHRREQGVTTFCLEAHVTYHREVRGGDPLRFTTVLLGHDAKRLHYIHAMYHATEGFLASTNELMSLHVSQATRRAAPRAPSGLARLAAIQAAHDALPRPPMAGRRIGLSTQPTTPQRGYCRGVAPTAPPPPRRPSPPRGPRGAPRFCVYREPPRDGPRPAE